MSGKPELGTGNQEPGTGNQGFLVKGTAYSLTSLVAVQALAMVSSIVVARLLGAANQGMLSDITRLSQFALLLASLGIPTALTKFAAQARIKPSGQVKSLDHSTTRLLDHSSLESFSLGTVVGTSLVTMLVPAVLLSSFLLFGAGWVGRAIFHEPGLAPLIRIVSMVFLVNALCVNFSQALLQGLREVRRISIINVVQNAVGLPIIVGLTFWLRLRGTVIAQLPVVLLATVLFYAALVRSQFRLRELKFDRRFLPRLMNVAFPAFMSGLVMVPALLIVQARLTVSSGLTEVGLFSVTFGLFQLIQFLPGAVGMPLVPMIAESHATDPDRLRRLTRTSLDVVAFTTLVLASAFGVFARPLVLILYGHRFAGATQPLILMTGAVVWCCVSYVVGHYFAGTGKMWTGMGFNLLWFVLLVGVGFLRQFAGFGAQGLAAAFWIAYCVMTIGTLIYARRAIRIAVGYPVLVCLLSTFMTALSRFVLDRMHGLSYVAAGLAAFAVVSAVAYWLLPAKVEFITALSLLRTSGRAILLRRLA